MRISRRAAAAAAGEPDNSSKILFIYPPTAAKYELIDSVLTMQHGLGADFNKSEMWFSPVSFGHMTRREVLSHYHIMRLTCTAAVITLVEISSLNELDNLALDIS